MDAFKAIGLLCPLCFDIMQAAATLRCGHSFCKNCLGDDDKFVCPLCLEENPESVGTGQVESQQEEKPTDTDPKQAADDLPAVGNLDLGKDTTTKADPQDVKTADDVKKTGDQVEAGNAESATLATVGNEPKVVTVVQIPRRACNVNGMAAKSKDAVVVGYGWDGKGSDCFSVSGNKTQYLKAAVGNVCDIAFLTDGKSFVSLGDNTGCVLDTSGEKTDTKYTFTQGLGHPCICTDQEDNIYVVNGNPSVYIFKGNSKKPHTIVPTGKILPLQVCVTKAGVMITSTCNFSRGRITVYDKKGAVGSSIVANGSDNDDDNEDGECLYAAVDDKDRVLIARVRRWSSVISLTRYTLDGTKLIKEDAFGDVTIPHQIDMACWCYLVSLAPHMLVFANDCFLYFVELPS